MRQRAVIAMALACDPDVVIADEPTTALDVLVQDKILRELRYIQRQLNMSMIYISHDIAAVAEMSHRIAVMYAGKIVEVGETAQILRSPLHPYTKALMSAFPSLKGEKQMLETLPGEPPNLVSPPPGCRFHPRCPFATSICREQEPPLEFHRDRPVLQYVVVHLRTGSSMELDVLVQPGVRPDAFRSPRGNGPGPAGRDVRPVAARVGRGRQRCVDRPPGGLLCREKRHPGHAHAAGDSGPMGLHGRMSLAQGLAAE